MNSQKPHVALLPYPTQGHLNPFMQLAKLLLRKDFHITFINTKYNEKRLIRSNGNRFYKNVVPDFQFKSIDDGLSSSNGTNQNVTQNIWDLSMSASTKCLAPLKTVLRELNACANLPKITCIITDGLMSCGIKAGQELGIPAVAFWTASAVGFSTCLAFDELIRMKILPLKDEDFESSEELMKQVSQIPGVVDICLRDMPTLIRTTNPSDTMLNFMSEESQHCLTASAIIFNTFENLENDVIKAIKETFPRIYNVGSLSFFEKCITLTREEKSLSSNLWKEDPYCFDWLDKQEHDSVLYVNYGSITVLTETQFQEFAWGLAYSKHKFLWVLREDVVGGNSAKLPQGYMEEIQARGLVVHWCQQDRVLSHPSVRAFLTHGGWNSTLESICNGKPVLCWPFFDEQPINCKYLCDVWEIGMEVDHKVSRKNVEALVKQIMEGEKGEEMKKKALEWKNRAQAAVSKGGSSYMDFERFVEDLNSKTLPKPSISNIQICLRTFIKIGTHHEGKEFDAKGQEPKYEIPICTRKDATLGDLTLEIKDYVSEIRSDSKLSFAFVYLLNGQKSFRLRKVGMTHLSERGPDDSKALDGLGFQSGYYLDVAII